MDETQLQQIQWIEKLKKIIKHYLQHCRIYELIWSQTQLTVTWIWLQICSLILQLAESDSRVQICSWILNYPTVLYIMFDNLFTQKSDLFKIMNKPRIVQNNEQIWRQTQLTKGHNSFFVSLPLKLCSWSELLLGTFHQKRGCWSGVNKMSHILFARQTLTEGSQIQLRSQVQWKLSVQNNQKKCNEITYWNQDV